MTKPMTADNSISIDAGEALTGAELARWCYANPCLAARTIEGLRVPNDAQARVSQEAMDRAAGEAGKIEDYKAANPDWESKTRPARDVLAAPETCTDCGKIDPCDDDCPNFVEPPPPAPLPAGEKMLHVADAAELPDILNPPAINQLFARDDLYTARAVFARLHNFGFALVRASPPHVQIAGEVRPLDWLAAHTNYELSFNGWDEDPTWQLHSVNGGRNDREWTLRATGSTPEEALRKAMASPVPSTHLSTPTEPK